MLHDGELATKPSRRWQPPRVTINPAITKIYQCHQMQSSNAHILCSQSLTQISTKLERERKGRRWTSISYPHPQRDLNISYKSWFKPWERERRGWTLAHKMQQWGMAREGKREDGSQPYPITQGLSPLSTRTGIFSRRRLEFLSQTLLFLTVSAEDTRTGNSSSGQLKFQLISANQQRTLAWNNKPSEQEILVHNSCSPKQVLSLPKKHQTNFSI